ncbi:hypothetical protein LWI29_011031 [Acer saccharum]|uniref:Uncharacterized protein n=1 Tax=Acer saccharum TaxID=4024 RepID=A0AA39RUW2_ACESA|nr:hypothetical protein LWI29_011031 [Acer saccharum]
MPTPPTTPTSGSAPSTGHPTSGSAAAPAVTTPTITRLAQGNPPSPGSNLISLNASSQIPFKLAKEIMAHTLNGLTDEFKELTAAVRVRDSPISFEDLHDKLLDEELTQNHGQIKEDDTQITAQLSQRQNNYKGKGGRGNRSGSNPPNPNHGRPGQSYGYSGQPSNFIHSSPQSNQSRQYPSNGQGFTSKGASSGAEWLLWEREEWGAEQGRGATEAGGTGNGAGKGSYGSERSGEWEGAGAGVG